MGKLLEFCK